MCLHTKETYPHETDELLEKDVLARKKRPKGRIHTQKGRIRTQKRPVHIYKRHIRIREMTYRWEKTQMSHSQAIAAMTSYDNNYSAKETYEYTKETCLNTSLLTYSNWEKTYRIHKQLQPWLSMTTAILQKRPINTQKRPVWIRHFWRIRIEKRHIAFTGNCSHDSDRKNRTKETYSHSNETYPHSNETYLHVYETCSNWETTFRWEKT